MPSPLLSRFLIFNALCWFSQAHFQRLMLVLSSGACRCTHGQNALFQADSRGADEGRVVPSLVSWFPRRSRQVSYRPSILASSLPARFRWFSIALARRGFVAALLSNSFPAGFEARVARFETRCFRRRFVAPLVSVDQQVLGIHRGIARSR